MRRSAREPRRPGEPSGRALDVVGDRRRDPKSTRSGMSGVTTATPLAAICRASRDQPRLVDAGGVEARDQQRGAPRRGSRLVQPRPQRTMRWSGSSDRARSAATASRSAMRRVTPCMSAARTTNGEAAQKRSRPRARADQHERHRDRDDERAPTEHQAACYTHRNGRLQSCRFQIADWNGRWNGNLPRRRPIRNPQSAIRNLKSAI